MTREMRLALRNAGNIDPSSIEDYLAVGGYQALAKARATDPSELIQMLEKSGKLRGRGGAAFNTGLKWSSAFQVDSDEKYVICNADEGEPGTYKDRTIMENDPHTVIEGILIAAYAIGAKDCIIYCRGEYQQSIQLLENAIKQAQERGLCEGVRIQVVYGAGSYICGEETALLESLEGRRGEPRLKPPFPTISGYRQKPTVINNVETFATVPVIVEKGAEWFSAIGSPSYPGTKVFSLSGAVVHKGCFETPTDITLRELIYDFGGGLPEGHTLKAVQLGGSSCDFLSPEMLDVQIDFDTMLSVGASLGSGAVLVIDETHNIVDILVGIAEFFVHESCGKCIPCRLGSQQVAQTLKRLADGSGCEADLETLRELAGYMKMSSFCPLGQSATTALMSALKLFEDDFQAKLQPLI